MSRIGKKPVIIPANCTVDIAEGNAVTVKGPKGTLSYTFHPDMILKVEGNVLTVERPDDEHLHKSLHGLTRTLLHNMVEGVEKGYTKELDVNGVGYRAEKKGTQLVMRLGFSHEVFVDEIPGITHGHSQQASPKGRRIQLHVQTPPFPCPPIIRGSREECKRFCDCCGIPWTDG